MLYWVSSSESKPRETRILYVTRVKGNQKQNKKQEKDTFMMKQILSVIASQAFPPRSGNTSALEMFSTASGSRVSEGHESARATLWHCLSMSYFYIHASPISLWVFKKIYSIYLSTLLWMVFHNYSGRSWAITQWQNICQASTRFRWWEAGGCHEKEKRTYI